MSRTILIGDLHGCCDDLLRLVKKCNVKADDRVIVLGDLIDRGPDNDKCVDWVMQRERVQGSQACILGNHEERHIQYADIERKKGYVDVQVPTHIATRQQLRPEHYDYFRRLPLFIRLPEFNVVAVHAGVYPGRPIEAQEPRHLLHAQMFKPYDKWGNPTRNYKTCWPSRVPDNEDGWAFWTKFYDGPETIVFGHSVLDKPLITDKVIGIDGGSVFGRQLHAYILPDKVIVSVNGAKDYGRGKRGQPTEEEAIRGASIRSFLIHGDVRTFS